MDSTTPLPDVVDSPLTDPAALMEAADVRSTVVVREQDKSHFETRDEYAGFVIVGITNDDGEVLLFETENGSFWRLSHARVDNGADYVGAAVDSVHTHLGHEAAIDRIVQGRQFDAVLEDSQAATAAAESDDTTADPDDLRDLDGHTRAYDVLFEASLPAAVDADSIEFDGDHKVSWFDSLPDGAPGGLPGEDIRLFFD